MRGRAEGLDTPVQFLKGIGPKRAQQFARLGVETVGQLLFHVPHRYVDRTRTLPISQLVPGEEVTVFGRVAAAGARRTRRFKQLVSCMVRDNSGMVEAVWFNRPDLKDRFRAGQEVVLSGKVTKYRNLQFVNPDFEVAGQDGFSGMNTIIPVYPLTEGLSGWTVRRAVKTAMDGFLNQVPETLVPEMLDHYGFGDIRQALAAIHFPTDVAAAEKARERLIYDELFYLQLVLALRRRRYAEARKGASLRRTGKLSGVLLSKLGFEFTAAQKRVTDEILADMESEKCMNRLLQGDVGSGKTVVALHAMMVAVENRTQAVLMAPTEILATQHFQGWQATLASSGAEARLLTGSTRQADRREILEGLSHGKVNIVFGTHALIEEGVEFARLGLVVVDEQHRFGVMQRAALLNKGLNPDFLVMTATPIPRTLTLTLYGDLDVSVLDEKPPGRKPVKTRVVPDARRAKVYGFIEERIADGEQVFVVCPLIEQSEKLDVASAMETFESVRAAFPRRRVGLVHGRMRSDERGRVMDGFRSGELDILVSTTVIEVGVDIPNATVMLVEHPERFGLAQLHQLRGRIGRGQDRSYCVLMLPRTGLGETFERLRFFERTSDGFALAEKDLELRGPGQLLGTRQHGLPDLRIADPVRDQQWLENARQDAFRMVELDPELSSPQNGVVRRTVKARYAGREELLRVG
ncbi:MAG: ATP-dependent DNA helicase RecG [candidate division WOR-3 bacterium]|nr:MAG: ATP-dependent DNA helicase RecG [candidate division WOR-3 bacterium]